MPKYKVQCDEIIYRDAKIIEADNENDAWDTYREMLDDGNVECYDSEYSNSEIELITETETKKRKEMGVHILAKKEKDREHAFWYNGNVARIRWYFLVSSGKIYVNLPGKRPRRFIKG